MVFRDYLGSSTAFVDGRSERKKVPPRPATDAEREILINLPNRLREEIGRSGRQVTDYRVYGSAGQPNRYFTLTPWVAALHRSITTSTTKGYYVALLFHEQMTGCVLSLNQGFTEFRNAFGTSSLATRKIHESAELALSYLDVLPGFIPGKIELGATTDFGKGYEHGAILSKAYTTDVGADEFSGDFKRLLDAYDILREKIGFNILDAIPAAAEDEFQDAATALSKPGSKRDYVEPPPGPVPPPPRTPRMRGPGFKRNPLVAGVAILNAEHLCELDRSHLSFTARRTKQNFVEAHHLIPVQFQGRFNASLDILENIVALCPTCHRKVHHGLSNEKSVILSRLLSDRDAQLESRGLKITSQRLLEYYRSELEEE